MVIHRLIHSLMSKNELKIEKNVLETRNFFLMSLHSMNAIFIIVETNLWTFIHKQDTATFSN